MRHNLKRMTCLLLSVLLAGTALSGCGSKESKIIEDMEKEEAASLTFSITGGADVMPIAGFVGPYPGTYAKNGETQPEYISDEYFQMIADCGINFINYSTTDYNVYGDLVFTMLELGEKYGIGMYVTDTLISDQRGDDALSVLEMGERISNYSDYPAFCGVYVTDEPMCPGFKTGDSSRNISEFAPIYNNLAELGVTGYVNLFPSYASDERENFEAYVKEMLAECDIPYLSYDHYVWDEGKEIADYFYDMSVVRREAEENDIPFWSFIQAGSQWNDSAERFDSTEYWPDEGQFDWNVNTCLAYGAKGIQYFTLIQPLVYAYAESTDWDFERNGLIGAWGNKNRWYYYAQDINKQISAVDEVLMNAKSKGVIVSGEQAAKDNELSDCILEETSWRELDSVTGDALIGCFNYQGKTALYVVNYDYEYAQEISLALCDNYKFYVIMDGEKNLYNGDHLTLDMRAGEGALVVFE